MDITGIGAVAPISKTKPVDPALEKAAKAFEAVFARQMIGAMRSASLGEGMLDSSATEQFRDMSDARTADAIAGGHALGIADILIRQLGPKTTAPTYNPAPVESDRP
jgi:peptidoglycan hydrolase FlgJ